MNYEERYKQAIEAAKRELHCCGSLDCDAARQIFRLFPELRESEDERIRKGLIKGLSAMRDIHKHQTFSDDAISIDDAIAWLEKQDEQKPSWKPSEEQINELITAMNNATSPEGAGILESLYNEIIKL